MFDYAVLLFGSVAIAGVVRLLVSAVTVGSGDGDDRRAGVYLVVVAYALAELVPGRFVTVTPAVDLAVGVLTLVCLAAGLALLFGQNFSNNPA